MHTPPPLPARGVRRVFIGPTEVAGIAAGLVQGFRECGVDAESILSIPHPFKYSDESVSWLAKVWQLIGAARAATKREKILRKAFFVLWHRAWGWLVLARVIFNFDAFIFPYGQTFTDSHFELWLLKRLNKKIVFIYVGSDARPPYMDGSWFPSLTNHGVPKALNIVKLVQRVKKKILLNERYADYSVNYPSTAHFHERSYINWFAMGIPKALPPGQDAVLISSDYARPVRILHSPSNPLVKGTWEILAVLDRLRQKGHLIELVQIQGMPNEVVLQELSRCDFVVDQLYSDTPLAAFAAEAATFGKPTVVAGYFADQVKNHLDSDDLPPSLYVLPSKLEGAIEHLILDSDFRLKLGEQARKFVSTRWSPSAVAGRYLKLLNDDVPNNWWSSPATVDYLKGCGLHEGDVKILIGTIVEKFDARVLCVADKPDLEAALVKFSQE